MKKVAGIVVVLAVLGLAVAIGSGRGRRKDNRASTAPTTQTGTSASAPATADQVTIKNYQFKPSETKVKTGTTITWTNQDDTKHNIAYDSGTLMGQEGPLFGRGETYTMTFDQPGTYNYHCRPHPYMKGTVIVE